MSSHKPEYSRLDEFFYEFSQESTPESSPIAVPRKRFLSNIRALIGLQDPMTRPRSRPETLRDLTPAAIQLLEPRVLMSATTVDLDIARWNNPTNGAQAELQPITNVMTFDLAVSPDGATVAAAEQNGSVVLIQAANGQTIRTLSGHTKMITAVDYSPDGSKIATASHDRTLKIWNASTGDLVRTIALPELSGELEWSPDGNTIALGVHPSTLAMIDTQTGTIIRSVDNSGEATRFSFSPNGTMIAGGDGKNVKIYNSTTLQPALVLTGLTEQVYSIDFSPDGRFVAAGDNGGHLAVWNAQTGQLVSLQSDFAGKPSAQGGIWTVAFTKDSRHVAGADFTGKVIVYDATALPTGGQLTEVRRYQTGKVPLSIIGSPSNHTFILTTAESPSTSKVRVFDLPDPPPPPPLPQPPAEPPVKGPQEKKVVSTSINTVLQNLAIERMQELGASIRTDASQLPALLRRQAELARELPQHASSVAAQQRIVHTIDADRLRVEGELAELRRQYNQAHAMDNGAGMYQAERGINSKTQVLSGILANLNQEQATLTSKTTALSKVQTEHASVVSLIDTFYGRLNSQCTEYTAYAALTDIDATAAAAQAEGFVRTGVREGEDTLPHVRPSVTILDRQMGSGILGIRLLNQQITEVREHPSPVLTKSGGSLEVTARIRNDGDRAGLITVVIGGISDLHPSIYAPQTVTVSLEPGKEKDFIAVVQIPQGKDATGSVWMQFGSPDENSVVQTLKNREPRPMDAASYIQGEGAVLHNARIIAATDGTGTSAERLQKYLTANPQEAASIAQKMQTGEMTESLAFTQMFKTAQQESMRVADARAEGVVNAMDSLQEHELDSTSKAALLHSLLSGANSSFWVAAGVSDSQGNIPDAGKQAYFTVMSMGQRELFDQVLGWYEGAYGYLRDALATRTDTIMGKILVGASEQLWSASTETHRWEVAISLQQVTDIPAQKFIEKYEASSSWQEFGEKIRALMTEGQYGELFGGYRISELPYVVAAHPDIPATAGFYDGSSPIRIRFDVFTAGKNIREVQAILDSTVIAQTAGSMFVDIPVSAINRSADGLKVTLRIVLDDGTRIEIMSDTFNVRPSSLSSNTCIIRELSTSKNAERRIFENKILNNLTFPVEPSGWVTVLGSEAHTGQNLFALDMSKEGDTDSPIFMAATGYIEHVNIEDGRVIVRHQTDDGRVWYTQYEHMTHILEDVTGVTYIGTKEAASKNLSPAEQTKAAQDRAEAKLAIAHYIAYAKEHQIPFQQGAVFGKLGNEGPATSGSHIHMAVYDADGNSIDQFRWADLHQPGITVMASVEGRNMSLQWDAGAEALVYASERIAIQRVQTVDANGRAVVSHVAYAWEAGKSVEEMQRVVWVKIGTNNSGQDVFAWQSTSPINGTTSIWRKKDGVYEFINIDLFKIENNIL